MSGTAAVGHFVSWDGGCLLIGRALGVTPMHAHYAIQIAFGSERGIRFRPGDSEPWTEYGGAIIASRQPHAMDAPERSDSGTANAHAGHGAGPSDSTSAAAAAAGHTGDQGHGGHGPAGGMTHHSAYAAQMTELHQRMLADPVIRDRVLADTAMPRVMGEMMRDTTSGLSPEHRAHMREMMAAPRTARPSPARRPATSSQAPAARTSTPPRPARRDPHAGHDAPAKPAARDTSAHHDHHQ